MRLACLAFTLAITTVDASDTIVLTNPPSKANIRLAMATKVPPHLSTAQKSQAPDSHSLRQLSRLSHKLWSRPLVSNIGLAIDKFHAQFLVYQELKVKIAALKKQYPEFNFDRWLKVLSSHANYLKQVSSKYGYVGLANIEFHRAVSAQQSWQQKKGINQCAESKVCGGLVCEVKSQISKAKSKDPDADFPALEAWLQQVQRSPFSATSRLDLC